MVLAHGVSSRGELPLPLTFAVWAAAAALVVSFLALGARWRTPHLARVAGGHVVPGSRVVLAVVEPVARLASVLLFVLVVVAGLAGEQSPAANVAPVTIYVVMWVVLQITVCVAGDVWSVLSPIDTLASGVEAIAPRRTIAPAPSWSAWMAPLGALGFVFLELIHPSGDSPRLLAIAIIAYVLVMLAAAWRWGRGWLAEGETLALHLGLLAAMAPVRRTDDGRLAVRAPLSGLAGLRMTAPATATLLVVLGAVSFDGFGSSPLWRDLVPRRTGWAEANVRLIGLLAAIAVVAALYLVGVRAMAVTTGRDVPALARTFAPSLVPIVFGYTVAHYLLLAIDETQTFVFRLSDPLGRGWDLFGGADGSVNYDLVSPATVAWFQVAGVVAGHIAGVVVSHDRAVADFDPGDAQRSQYTMMFVMVLYSVLGLWLLFSA